MIFLSHTHMDSFFSNKNFSRQKNGCFLILFLILVMFFNFINFSDGVGDENGSNCTLCVNGISQSPINIIYHSVVFWPLLGDLNINYQPAPAVIKNRGHEIEVEWRGDAGGVILYGTEYKLKQCHWHIPSEHTINGIRYNMELHMVHISTEGNIAVIGILYKLGWPDYFLARFFPYFRTSDSKGTDVGILDPKHIRYGGREYYRYNGSLTTPPCSENIIWTVLKTVRTVSWRQIMALRDAVENGIGNARPIQPLHGRTVYLF
ncbi:hypothetical protein ACP275_10G168200 [Erythranthe tilingii]